MANGALSSQGLNFIGGWEGFQPKLYNDATGNCTIGYGHLVHLRACNGSEPDQFRRGLSQAEGLALLKKDAATAVSAVNKSVHVLLTQPQFDSLVSFAFNVGGGAFAGSTLLRVLNQGNKKAVPAEMMRWTNSGLPGLVNRRRAEVKLFSQGIYR